MTSTTVRALSQSDVFRSLDEAELVRLASACGHAHLRTRRAGVPAWRSRRLHVRRGRRRGRRLAVLRRRSGRPARGPRPEPVIRRARPVDDGPRVATVTARTRSVLVVVPRRAAAEVMARHPRSSRHCWCRWRPWSAGSTSRPATPPCWTCRGGSRSTSPPSPAAGRRGRRARRLGACRRVADPGRPGPPDRRVPPAGQPSPDEPGDGRVDHPPRTPHRRRPPTAALHRRHDALTSTGGGHWTHSSRATSNSDSARTPDSVPRRRRSRPLSTGLGHRPPGPWLSQKRAQVRMSLRWIRSRGHNREWL